MTFAGANLRIVALLALMFLAIACVPRHTVKPLPEFVKAGLEPGDTVTVTTRNGESYTFEITDIEGDVLLGDGRRLLLKDIATLQKHSWSRPVSPCGGDAALGCSVPLLVNLASDLHGHYKNVFYDACAQHDYCYRHGFVTYGADRLQCDEAFLEQMQGLCPAEATSAVGKVFAATDGSIESRGACLSAASDFYVAVRRYGIERFATADSTHCEYDGPMAPQPGAPSRENATKEPE